MESMAGKNRTRISNQNKNNSFAIALKIKSFITVIITNPLHWHGKSHIYCHCKRISLLSNVLATKKTKKLICFHEPGNGFDSFVTKTVSKNGEIVGHLPKEIPRITKYVLDRGASMYCTLSAEHYHRSRLVQGVLEIDC